MMSMIGGKSITNPQQAKGQRIATSSPGGTATLVARAVLRKWGLDPDKGDASLAFMGRDAGRYAALESVDVAMLSPPGNIKAQQQGYPELAFAADYIRFPQNGFGTTQKKIQENPDDIYHMIRATMRGLMFITDPKNKGETMANEMYRYLAPIMSRELP